MVVKQKQHTYPQKNSNPQPPPPPSPSSSILLPYSRYAGVAQGVGTAKILGRVHIAELKIGRSFFPCTFTVLEKNDVEFLFGLDMLKRHQCVLDLRRHVLQVRRMRRRRRSINQHP